MAKVFNHVYNLPQLEVLESEEINNSRFYISPTGKKLPSVTTVLGHFNKRHINAWRSRVGEEEANRVSTRASIRGTKFHALVERYLGNQDNLFEGIMPDMKQAFSDAQNVLDLIDNIHYIESSLYSETLGIAGRCDCIAEFAGVPSIIDFKTSKKEKKESWIEHYFEQGTAYALMYEELTGTLIDQVVIIISVDGESSPQVFVRDKAQYVQGLLDKIELYKEETLQ